MTALCGQSIGPTSRHTDDERAAILVLLAATGVGDPADDRLVRRQGPHLHTRPPGVHGRCGHMSRHPWTLLPQSSYAETGPSPPG